MARQLTPEEIDRLASQPKVKRIAVENFLMTVHYNETYQGACANMEVDAASYRWNTETVGAIWSGIQLAFFKETK